MVSTESTESAATNVTSNNSVGLSFRDLSCSNASLFIKRPSIDAYLVSKIHQNTRPFKLPPVYGFIITTTTIVSFIGKALL